MEKKETHTDAHHLEGAEAILTPCVFGPFAALDKQRLAKPYRPAALDERIRTSRTKVEARLLARAKEAGVPCPVVLAVGPFDIVMSQVGGKTLNRFGKGEVSPAVFTLAGLYLARLHGAGMVHGDYTPANLMLDLKNEKKSLKSAANAAPALVVIDFGLGFVTSDEEDFAVDVLTMKKALGEKAAREAFLSGYKREGEARVLKLMAEVEKRARYQDRGA